MATINFANLLIKFVGQLAALGDNTGSGGQAEVLYQQRYGNGTTAGNANILFFDTRTLGASANEDLDLTTLTDGNGVALGSAEIVALIIEAAAANGDEIQIAPGAANSFDAILSGTTPVEHVVPGGISLHACKAALGWTVDATHKILNIANADTAAGGSYTITILARTA